MPSYNRVILAGNITRDIELRHLPSNTAVATIGLAVNESFKDRDGNRQDRATFVDCEAFGRTAEVMSQYLGKGRPVLIEGKLRLDQWQDKEGNTRSKLKVIIDGFTFVDSREGGGEQRTERDPGDTPRASRRRAGPAEDGDDIPF